MSVPTDNNISVKEYNKLIQRHGNRNRKMSHVKTTSVPWVR